MYLLIPVKSDIKIESFVLSIDAVRPKGYEFEGEMHDFWELVYLKSGKATATAEERVYEMSPGQLVFHKPMEFHRISSSGGTSPHLLIISFKASGERMKKLENRCVTLSLEEQQRFEKIARRMARAVSTYSKYPPPEHFEASVSASALLTDLLLELSLKNDTAPTLKTPDEQLYGKIINVLSERCEEDLSVSDIAKLCNMSESAMKRVFKKFSDRGVASFFMYIKLRRATELMREGLSITEVSNRLGFSSPEYFHTVFKREFGMTPRTFKKEHK